MTRLDCDAAALKGRLCFNYGLARMSSWRAGGAAECFFAPADADDLAYFLSHCVADHPVFCIGLGSNLLVRDGGVRGVVIMLRKGFDVIERNDGTVVRAGAGAVCTRLARYCVGAGLEGLEFMVGIPGTVGGALRMNAGAFGGETWERVVRVQTMNRHGRLRWRPVSDFDVAYRCVVMPDEEWFVAGEFALRSCRDGGALRARLDELLHERNTKQPVNEASCGSVFKNPHNDYAARLIESCNLKSCSIGAAEVSVRHANFIINRGGATAADIEKLIKHVRGTVERSTGVRLELEVGIVGEKA